jgi:uncharacterized protein YneF (UPF0154 family)
MNTKILLILPALVLLSNLVFADLASNPLDIAIPIGVLFILLAIVVIIGTGGLFLLYWAYKRIKKEKINENEIIEIKKNLKRICKFVLIVIGLIILAFLISSFFTNHSRYAGGDYLSRNPRISASIIDAIKGTSPSGDTLIPEFSLGGSGGTQAILVNDLTQNSGLESNSIVFSLGKYANTNSNLTLLNNPSGIMYSGSTKLRTRARVICKPTGTLLQDYITNLNDPNVTIGQTCSAEFQPCCAVILQRPTS